jgi:hypothetical protein
MGCYPFFACQDWSKLDLDLEPLGNSLISLALVTDPLGNYKVQSLEDCFRDLVIPFKQHFLTNLDLTPSSFVSNHHQRNARIALSKLTVEKCQNPIDYLDDWTGLYEELKSRHQIKGITTFSRASFFKQLSVQGLVMFRAVYHGATVGMILWYIQGKMAYYHLGSSNNLGYIMKAAFALFWRSIEYFASTGLKWLVLGSGPGLEVDKTDGLARFKSGWATETRTVYFCGRIFNRKAYAEILKAKGIPQTSYFPAYRLGEFL